MILKMKRYSFLVYHKEYNDFLEKIREIGVLHIIEKEEGTAENDNLRDQMLLAARVKNTLKKLEKLQPKNAQLLEANDKLDGLDLLSKIELTLTEKDLLMQKLQLLEKELERMEVWGSFSHDRLAQLNTAGFNIGFYSCNQRKFDQEWEVLYNAFEIDVVGSTMYFVTVTSPGQTIDIEADPVKLSDSTAEQIAEEITEVRSKIKNQQLLIEKLAVEDYNSLKNAQANLLGNIDYAKVVLNTKPEADNRVMVLEGWCPEESEHNLNEYLTATDLYYETSVPSEEDKVPIKLKNNRFSKLYEMIGDLYDIPNYHELDLTPFFAPFYMLFFGLCLGDVGYGLVLLLIAIFVRRKAKPGLKSVMTLLIWLGSATVVMGTVSGTFFGYNLLESKIEWLEKFKVVMLDPNQLFYTSLIIGVVQILFGMIVKAVGQVRRYGWPASFATWGWLIILFGCGGTFAASSLLTVDPMLAKWIYIVAGSIGGLFVFILNDIKRNPLINIGAGLWDAYNMATGLLGDVLSYIRLFALGISGAVMGFVFNDLAIQLSGNIPVLSPIIMIIIMLIGHGINIFMSSLSAFVHPMRLTFVEFYKNAGFEGGGKKYKPFAAYKEEESLF